ncbi:MAG: hypothetical protein WKF53_16170 [Rubrobacter sp.]
MLLIFCFAIIFFGARSCVSAQEATQVRKYVTSADSTLSDSASVGNEDLQATLAASVKGPEDLDAASIDRAADATRRGYQEALRNPEVPSEFEDAHHYMITALGIRADATDALAEAAGEDDETFSEALALAIEDYKLSDVIVLGHYVPASEEALGESGREDDRGYLYEPEPFMDYEVLGLSTGSADSKGSTTARGVPSGSDSLSSSRDIGTSSVEVAGRPLYPGADVTLGGSDELIFSITVTNLGGTVEASIPVEVVLNTRAERQALPATIERIEPGGAFTVEVRGFRPGEFDETAEVNVRAGPIEKERNEQDNVLTGTVTFGL